MAMQSLRLRRLLSLLASNSNNVLSCQTTSPALTNPSLLLRHPNYLNKDMLFLNSRELTRCFSEGRQWKLYKEGDEITEDTVLFEGCDFNHWLITVDFPKDQKLSPEEMVATYERICAEGLNISIEEAKNKIYACSTTTYQGFQAIMTEAESEKFKDVPGVVFVLPDSYIDPVNKEYGGDKYENGVITPRPPPYNPQRERRDRNARQRNFQNYSQNPPQQYHQQGPSTQRNYPLNSNFGGRNDQGHQQNYAPPQRQPPQSPPMNGNFWGGNEGPQQSPGSGNSSGRGWGSNEGFVQSPTIGNFPGGGLGNNQGPPQPPGSGSFMGGQWGNNQGRSQPPESRSYEGAQWRNNQGPSGYQRQDGEFRQGNKYGPPESARNRGDFGRDNREGYDGYGNQRNEYSQRGPRNTQNDNDRGRY